ncbi:MAG: NAD(+)/NADH kinase [Clostridia bacterium]|nr:NAD(+)/NADH kinase [Clostridia bacterium]
MKIALVPNIEKDKDCEVSREAVKRLINSGAEVYMTEDGFGAKIVLEDELFSETDAVVTVGGDGTIIKYAKKAALHGIPLLGINAGRLGFLAQVEKDNLDLLDQLVSGNYTVSPRFMLKAAVYENGVKIDEGVALNDAIVTSGGIARLIDIEAVVGNDTISYRSDGLIVSTPTGSTAYSMSAGGPIIDPDVRCFAVTPICSHSLTARPMIIGENTKLVLRLPSDSEEKAVFSLDGRFTCNLDKNMYIEIVKSEYDAMLINLGGNTIYSTLSKKFRR